MLPSQSPCSLPCPTAICRILLKPKSEPWSWDKSRNEVYSFQATEVQSRCAPLSASETSETPWSGGGSLPDWHLTGMWVTRQPVLCWLPEIWDGEYLLLQHNTTHLDWYSSYCNKVMESLDENYSPCDSVSDPTREAELLFNVYFVLWEVKCMMYNFGGESNHYASPNTWFLFEG